ncbi:hypothetical protein CHUAL_012192 [Chamberlinius hualienensis]
MNLPLVLVLASLLTVQGDPELSGDPSTKGKRHHGTSFPLVQKSEFDEEKNQDLYSLRCNCLVHNATDIIKGSEFNTSNNAIKNSSCGLDVATNLIDGTTLGYFNVDFGHIPPKKLTLQFTSDQYELIAGSNVAVHVDSTTENLVAGFVIKPQTRYCTIVLAISDVQLNVTGVHSVFIVFEVDGIDPKKQTLDLDWFSFDNDFRNSKCSFSNQYQNLDDNFDIDKRFDSEPSAPYFESAEQLKCERDYNMIEAETFSKTNYAVSILACGEALVSNLTNGSYIAFEQVDFGDNGIDVITLNFLSETKNPVSTIVEIFLNEIDAYRLARFQLNFTGIKCQFYEFKFNVWKTRGEHDVFIRFTNLDPTSTMALNWINLSKDLRKHECPQTIFIIPDRGQSVVPIFDISSIKHSSDSQESLLCLPNIRSIIGANFNETNFAQSEKVCHLRLATNLIDGTYLTYYDVNFNGNVSLIKLILFGNGPELGPSKIQLWIAKSSHDPKDVYLRSVYFRNPSSYCVPKTIPIKLKRIITGIHHLKIVFTYTFSNPYPNSHNLMAITLSDQSMCE